MPRNPLLDTAYQPIYRAVDEMPLEEIPRLAKHIQTRLLDAITDDPMEREEFLRWGLLFADTSNEFSARMAKCYAFFRFGPTYQSPISLLRWLIDESNGAEIVMWWRSQESERKHFRKRLLRLVPKEGSKTSQQREIRAIKKERDDFRKSILLVPSYQFGRTHVIPLSPSGMQRYVLRMLGLAGDSHDRPYYERLAICQRNDCQNVFLNRSIAGHRGGSYRMYCSNDCQELMKARTAAGRKAASRAGISYREWLKRQAK